MNAPTPAPSGMTDTEVKTALWSAGIPGTYHAKDMSLHNLQIPVANNPVAKQASDFAEHAKFESVLGKCVEVSTDGRDGLDLTFLTARSMVLRGNAVAVINLPNLVEMTMNRYAARHADNIEDLHGRDFLFVLGSIGKGVAPYPPEKMYETEWAMKKWILSGKPLVMQGEGRLSMCDWWSKGFTDLFYSKCPNRFEIADKPAPAIPQPKPGSRKA